jgi:predicted permease
MILKYGLGMLLVGIIAILIASIIILYVFRKVEKDDDMER